MTHKWYDTEQILPPTGVEIIAELNGCKFCKYLKMKVRIGEGLGYIKRWRHLTKEEEGE